MARKKPGKTSKAKPKVKANAARSRRSAGKAKARRAAKSKTKKQTKKRVIANKSARTSSARRSRPAKRARVSSTRKTKKAVKPTSAAKSKSSATKSARAATPSPSASAKSSKSSRSAKSASAAPARSAKLTKAAARAAQKPDATKKAPGKKGAAAKPGPVPDAQGYVVINGRRVRMISTKGLTIPKRSSSNHAAADREAASSTPKKPRKSRLSPKDLEIFRELLLLRRRQLAGDLTSMETEALRSGGGNASHMPIHMADIGTDTFDQDFMLGLAANERVLLKEIDEALERIDKGEYGICALTGNPIPKSRLNAKPWAKYTVEAARMVERGLNTA